LSAQVFQEMRCIGESCQVSTLPRRFCTVVQGEGCFDGRKGRPVRGWRVPGSGSSSVDPDVLVF